MPYARVPLSNGETIEFYVPSGMDAEQAASIAPQMWNYQQQGMDVLAAPPPPDKTIFGFGEEGAGRVGEIPKGIASGALGILGIGAEGLATLLTDNENEEALVELIGGLTEAAQSPFAPKYGYEDTLTRKLSEGVGSTVPFLFGGLGGLAGKAAATGLAGTSGAGIAAQRARQAGATQEEIDLAALWRLPVGLSEIAVPFAASKVFKGLRSQANAGNQVAQTTLNRIGRIARGVVAEGTQEAAAEIAQNLIAQDIYDPETGTFTGTAESFGIGAGVGGIIQGVLELMIPGRSRAPTPTPTAPDDTTAPPDTDFDDSPSGRPSPVDQFALPGLEEAGAAQTAAQQGTPPPETLNLKNQYPKAFAIPLVDLKADPRTLEDLDIPDQETYLAIRAAREAEAGSILPDINQLEMELGDPAQEAAAPEGVPTPEETDALGLFAPNEVFDVLTEMQQQFPTEELIEILEEAPPTVDTKARLEEINSQAAEIFGRPASAEGEVSAREEEIKQAAAASGESALGLGDAAQQPTQNQLEIAARDKAARTRLGLPPVDELAAQQGRNTEARRKIQERRDTEAQNIPSLGKGEEGFKDPQTVLYEEFNEEAEIAGAGLEDGSQFKKSRLSTDMDAQALPIPTADTQSFDIVTLQQRQPELKDGVPVTKKGKALTPDKGAEPYFRAYFKPETAIRAIAADVALRRATDSDGKRLFAEKTLKTNGFLSRVNHADKAKEWVEQMVQEGKLEQGTLDALNTQVNEFSKRYTEGETATLRVTPSEKKRKQKLEEENKKQAKLNREEAKKDKQEADETGEETIPFAATGLKQPKSKVARIAAGVRKVISDQKVEAVKTSSQPQVVLRKLAKEDLTNVYNEITSQNPDVNKIIEDTWFDKLNSDEQQMLLELTGEELMMLPSSAVSATMPKVTRRVKNAIEAGDAQRVYELLSESNNPLIARVAKAISENIGTTKIRLGGGRLGKGGLAGFFNPKKNEILIDPNANINAHLLLHEGVHAITSHTIANPTKQLDPYVKQLRRAYEYAKPVLSTAYGTTSLDEFVAEAQSNPRFRSELNGLPYIYTKGKVVTVWEKVKLAFQNMMRRLLNEPPVKQPSNTSNLDQLIEAILSPAPASRAAPILAMDVDAQLRQLGAQYRQGKLTNKGFEKNLNVVKKAMEREANLEGVGGSVLNGILPLNVLAEIYQNEIPSTQELFTEIKNKVGARSQILSEVKDVGKYVSQRVQRNTKRADILNNLVLESTMDKVDPSKPREYYSDYWVAWEVSTGKKRDSGATIYTTKEANFKTKQERNNHRQWLKQVRGVRNIQSWGGKDNKTKLAAWDKMQRQWNSKAFGKEGQQAYEKLRDSYASVYDRLMDTVDDRLVQFNLAPDLRKDITDKIFKRLRNKERIEPYFPLYRNGQHWLTFQMKQGGQTQPDPHKMLFEDRIARDNFIWELENNPDLQGKVDLSTITTKEDTKKGIQTKVRNMKSGAAFEVLNLLDKQKAPPEVKNSIMEVLMDSLPESNVLQMFRSRADVLGPEADALGVFNRRMPSFAQQIVNLEYDIPLQKIDQKIAKEVAADGSEKIRKVYEDSLKSYVEFANEPNIATMTKVVKSMTFAFTLGLNVSSVVANMTNLPIVVFPILGGKYGFPEAGRAMNLGRRMYMGTSWKRKATGLKGEDLGMEVFDGPSLANLDFNDPNIDTIVKQLQGDVKRGEGFTTDELKVLVDIMVQQGQANRSTVGEMLDQEAPERSGYQLFNNTMGMFFHQGERLNRQVTSVAAYKLELDRIKEKAAKAGKKVTKADLLKAAHYAMNEMEYTNSGAMIETAPRLAQSNVGSVALMYKRFGISMVWLQYRTAMHSLRNAKDPEAKRIAKRQLGALMGMTLMMAGVQGLPAISLISWLLNQLYFDDTEDDADSAMARMMGEGWWSGPLNQLTGWDIAPRIGMSNLLYRQRPNDVAGPIEHLAEATLGPAFGVAKGRFYDGASLLLDGEIRRGTERLAPAFLGNILRGERYAREGGPRTLRGDPMTEALDARELGGQFLGFAPQNYTKAMELNQLQKRKEREKNQKRSDLLSKRYRAYVDQDYEGMEEIDEEINEYNTTYPYDPITNATKRNSLRGNIETTQEIGEEGATGGMIYQNRRFRQEVRQRQWEELGID